MKLDKDPLGYLLRSSTGFAILELLHDGKARRPLEVRGRLRLHPQTAKEAVTHLNRLGLVTLSVPPGSTPRRTARRVGVSLVVRITAEGQEVLRLAETTRRFVRSEVRKRGAALPAATRAQWLPA